MSRRFACGLVVASWLSVGCGDRSNPFETSDVAQTNDTAGTDGATADTAGGTEGAQADTSVQPGTDVVGTDGVGTDATDGVGTDGTDTVGTDGAGTDGTGTDGTGTDGTDTVGTDATDGTGTDGTGTDGTGTDGTGTDGTGTDGTDGACVVQGTLTLAAPATGDTTGGANGQSVQGLECGTNIETGIGSPDHVWQFTAPSAAYYTFTLTGDFDSAIYVLDACGGPSGCLGLNDQIGAGGTTETVTVPLDADETIFVIVDGYLNDVPGVSGTYSLTAAAESTCTPFCAGNDCGDDGCGGECGVCSGGDVCTDGVCMPVAVDTSSLVINEIDYDQVGDDTSDFIELYNAGTGPATLSAYSIELVNGSDGKVYKTLPLSGAGDTLAAGGYLVLGSQLVVSALPGGALGIVVPGPATGWLQNGAPDGVRLVKAGSVMDGVAYEGVIAGVGEGTTAPSDDNAKGGDLSRCDNGSDTGDNGVDFKITTTLTPGAANSCAATPTVTFNASHAVFAAKCGLCHTVQSFGGMQIGAQDIATAYADSQKASSTAGKTLGAESLARIKSGNMPSGKSCTGNPTTDASKPACLTAAEQAAISEWVAAGQPGPK